MLTLYQFNSCPFCWKAKAILHYAKIPYQVVEVTPFSMQELDFTDHKKVPVLRDNSQPEEKQVIVESAKIVEHINTYYAKLPVSERDTEWMQWIDDKLVQYLPALIHPNMSTSFRNFKLILNDGQFSAVKGFFLRAVGSFVMPRVARKMKLKHSIEDAPAEFLSAIDHFMADGLQGQAFFAGEQAGMIDASAYGVLRSAAGMDVLEKAFAHHADFERWYQACDALMANNTATASA